MWARMIGRVCFLPSTPLLPGLNMALSDYSTVSKPKLLVTLRRPTRFVIFVVILMYMFYDGSFINYCTNLENSLPRWRVGSFKILYSGMEEVLWSVGLLTASFSSARVVCAFSDSTSTRKRDLRCYVVTGSLSSRERSQQQQRQRLRPHCTIIASTFRQ